MKIFLAGVNKEVAKTCHLPYVIGYLDWISSEIHMQYISDGVLDGIMLVDYMIKGDNLWVTKPHFFFLFFLA